MTSRDLEMSHRYFNSPVSQKQLKMLFSNNR